MCWNVGDHGIGEEGNVLECERSWYWGGGECAGMWVIMVLGRRGMCWNVGDYGIWGGGECAGM